MRQYAGVVAMWVVLLVVLICVPHAEAVTVTFLEAPDDVNQGVSVTFDLATPPTTATLVNPVPRSTQEVGSLQFDVAGVTATLATTRVAAFTSTNEPGGTPGVPSLSDVLEISITPVTISVGVDTVSASRVFIEFRSDGETPITGVVPPITVPEQGGTQPVQLYSVTAIPGLPTGVIIPLTVNALSDVEAPAAVPEPASLLLLGSGVAGFVALYRRRRGW
jgi:PEP-CTERM motif-containing protein